MGVTLLSQGMPNEPVVRPKVKGVDCRVREAILRQALRLGLPVRAELTRIGRQKPPSLIHSNGIWLPVNHWASSAARQLGVPLVIQPHGMLEPWSMDHKALKKRLAMALFQRRDLEAAKVLVATSDEEYRNIRNLGFTQPIAIIPNGIELEQEDSGSTQPVRNAELRTVLFLSRVHQVKGLINLVHAWAHVQPARWRLQIAGPDEGGHLAEVMHEARKAGIEACFDYIGEVDGATKATVYRNADLFVLPTFSENFGVVVAEALSHGLPVITTRGAPWADLETYRCGWWIDIGAGPLATALRQAMALSDDERRAMGERGRAYVQRYNWADIARQMADVYLWVLGQGPQPDCIHLN